MTNFIIIDGSYYCFYRYFALLNWWKMAHSEETFFIESMLFVLAFRLFVSVAMILAYWPSFLPAEQDEKWDVTQAGSQVMPIRYYNTTPGQEMSVNYKMSFAEPWH